MNYIKFNIMATVIIIKLIRLFYIITTQKIAVQTNSFFSVLLKIKYVNGIYVEI